MTRPIKYENISDLLKASPFDTEHNLDNSLTSDFFFENWHVRSPQLESHLTRFDEFMYNDRQPNRVVFLKGFAGNGKTTFIHTFIREREQYRHVYYNFQDLRGPADPPAAEGNADTAPDEVKLMLNRRLRSLDGIFDTFRFLRTHRAALKSEDFISGRLFEYLEAGPAEGFDPLRMDKFDIKDTFTCLFVHLFRQQSADRRTLLYFDNLDVATMSYIADRFLIYFQNAVSAAMPLSQHDLFAEEIDFRANYRFVFALRDANEAALNAHLAERIGFARAPYPLSFSGESFAQIADRRIQYAEAQPAERVPQDKFSSMLDVVLKDVYFQDVLLPLYNYNYRELIGVLVGVLEDQKITLLDCEDRYRLRGTLLFGLIRVLLRNNFLKAYQTTLSPNNDGYCYIDRVLLTVLINCSNYYRGRDQNHESDPYNLLFLAKDLKKVYLDVEPILEAIARCYLTHKTNRISLLTVLSTKVDDPHEFVREFGDQLSHALSKDDNIATERARNKAMSILLRVNPAGFTYVRYILPHYEFYSNLVDNPNSLFQDPARWNRKEQFSFEPRVDKVLQQVEQHVDTMAKFFESRYKPAGITADKFPFSKYCFRHQKKSKHAKTAGHSHTIKIVTQHIDYLEQYRERLLKSERDEEERRALNKALVSRVERYVELLAKAPDQKTATIFWDEFRTAIDTIVAKDYKDWTTRIVLDPKSGYDPGD